ncbi:hypothetical protein OH77DRAFT_1463497 [Trametes cingulata]|nr:hypothetical protein OH77DRAFT_1463497 [Trametes cingulata]
MGQHFQVYVVSRVLQPANRFRYQIVAAYHHEWCYQLLPLRALHRFFSLLQNRENASLVRDELWLLNLKSGEGLTIPAAKDDPALPCPYLSSLLAISWSVDLENGRYISGTSFTSSLLDVRQDCLAMDRKHFNDEGICIIDISDLRFPAYCFILPPQYCTLTAYEYIRLQMLDVLFKKLSPGYDPHSGPTTKQMMDEVFRSMFPDVADRFIKPTTEDQRKPEPDEVREHRFYVNILEAFWALVDLAGYRILSAMVVAEVWPKGPGSPVLKERAGRLLKVPLREETPTRLDVVTSLYLGFLSQDELDFLQNAFGASTEPHITIGKAILPPYEDDRAGRRLRTSIISRMLHEALLHPVRSFPSPV